MDLVIYALFSMLVVILLILPEKLKVFSNKGVILFVIFLILLSSILIILPIGHYFIPH